MREAQCEHAQISYIWYTIFKQKQQSQPLPSWYSSSFPPLPRTTSAATLQIGIGLTFHKSIYNIAYTEHCISLSHTCWPSYLAFLQESIQFYHLSHFLLLFFWKKINHSNEYSNYSLVLHKIILKILIYDFLNNSHSDKVKPCEKDKVHVFLVFLQTEIAMPNSLFYRC